jgi:LysM repeat protein
MSPEDYISSFKDAAIADMEKTGVPASITLAQGMYESDYGNSPLAKNAKNHFGIKCHKEWNGSTYHQDDDEVNECFRKYNQVQESYDDHSEFLRSRDRYQFLFDLRITDYKGWARGLKKAGYATNPQYADKLIDLIEKYDLNKLDHDSNKKLAKNESTEILADNKKDNPVIKKSVSSESQLNVTDSRSSNTVASINDIPVVRAMKGDSWLKLARENELELWQILDFNDADKLTSLREGEYVFIKPKKSRGKEEQHIVKSGETMRMISQLYGIKLNKLYRMNQMTFGEQPSVDKVLYLNKGLLFGVVL